VRVRWALRREAPPLIPGKAAQRTAEPPSTRDTPPGTVNPIGADDPADGPREQVMRIRTLALAVTLALSAAAVPAVAATEHGTFDITGEILAECPSGTYTTEGFLNYTMQAVESRSGNSLFNIVLTSQNVIVHDENGGTYRLRGTDHFRSRMNADGSEWMLGRHVFHLISDDGGMVESFNVLGHLQNGKVVSWDIGSCLWP
jgi:hypothetical protein